MIIILLAIIIGFFIVVFFGLIGFLFLKLNDNSEKQKLDNADSYRIITQNSYSIEPIGVSSPVYNIFDNNLDN